MEGGNRCSAPVSNCVVHLLLFFFVVVVCSFFFSLFLIKKYLCINPHVLTISPFSILPLAHRGESQQTAEWHLSAHQIKPQQPA